MIAKESWKEKQWLEKGQYISHLTPRQHDTVIKLVGNRCLVKCLVADVPTEALWDTGAQVSIASHEWVTTNLADAEVHPLEELLGDNDLDLKSANGSSIPYEGYVEVQFKLWNSAVEREVIVPLLVARDHLDYPIIGYNVIEEVLKYQENVNPSVSEQIITSLTASLPSVKPENILALVQFIQSNAASELCSVKTTKRDVLIPSGKTVSISCRANTESNNR